MEVLVLLWTKVFPVTFKLPRIVSVLLMAAVVVMNFDSRFRNSCNDLKLRLRSD